MPKDNPNTSSEEELRKVLIYCTGGIMAENRKGKNARFKPIYDKAIKKLKAYGIDQQIKELETLLANVPMPSLSYEQVENRIKQLKSQKGGEPDANPS